MKIDTIKIYKALKIASIALPIALMTIAVINGVTTLALGGNNISPTGGDPIDDPVDPY